MDKKSKLYSKAKLNNLDPPRVKSHIIKSSMAKGSTQPKTSSSSKEQINKVHQDLTTNSQPPFDFPSSSSLMSIPNEHLELSFEDNRKRPIQPKSSFSHAKSLKENSQSAYRKPSVQLPSINQPPKAKANVKSKAQSSKSTNQPLSSITKQRNPYLQPYKTKKSFKPFLKDNLWYTVILFLPSSSLFNLMLVSKKFLLLASKCDELWYIYYIRKFKVAKLEYHSHQSKWRSLFLEHSQKLHMTNYTSLSNKFLSKYKKNNYIAKKDHYYLSNNLFSYLKPKYFFEIDGKQFKIRHILSNKLLSHINFYANFDEHYQDMNKASKLRLLLNDQNMGFYCKVIAEYDLQKIKFSCTESDGLQSKICKVFYSDDLIISTFEKNFIFFINISLPICRICELLFHFLKGIHGVKLDYFCDSDSKFGLYDYSLLINLKSWNCVYYSLAVTTCDFKEDGDELVHFNENAIANSSPIRFDIKTICMNDFIANFLIFDIVLLSYKGDHVLCESKPLVIKQDKERVDYDEYGSAHYFGELSNARFKVRFNFNVNEDMGYYALVYMELRADRAFIERIFKKS